MHIDAYKAVLSYTSEIFILIVREPTMADPDVSTSSLLEGLQPAVAGLSSAGGSVPVRVAPSRLAGEALREKKRAAILNGPVLPTLLRLGLPTVGVLLAQTIVSVAETYWTAFLGTDVLAGMALVFPLPALMTAMSNGGIGGGVASAVARANGAGRHDEADALVLHALALAVVFGLLFTAGALLAGPALYRLMGGTGGALSAASRFSAWFFAGSVPIWIVNLLAAALRGAGEVRLPATVTLVGAAVVIPLSPALIFGVGPLPRMSIAGAGLAVGLYYCGAALVLLRYFAAGRGVLTLRMAPLRWATFRAILGVGAVSALSALTANLTILLVTGAVGFFGIKALAGYGIASRVDWLLIPLLFGLGSAVVTMVGASTGAGDHARARRVAWQAALIAVVVTECTGLLAAAFARDWIAIFTADPAVLGPGIAYMHVVAPSYGGLGLGMILYFACQGRANMLWPFLAGVARLAVAAGGGLLLAEMGGSMSAVLMAIAGGTVAYAALNTFGMLRATR